MIITLRFAYFNSTNEKQCILSASIQLLMCKYCERLRGSNKLRSFVVSSHKQINYLLKPPQQEHVLLGLSFWANR